MSLHVTIDNANEHLNKRMFGYIEELKEKHWSRLICAENGKLRMSRGDNGEIILADRAMLYIECKACRGNGGDCKECDGHGHER